MTDEELNEGADPSFTRKKISVIYHEILGDVSELISRVESSELNYRNIMEQMNKNGERQISSLVDLRNKNKEDIQNILGMLKRSVSTAERMESFHEAQQHQLSKALILVVFLAGFSLCAVLAMILVFFSH